MTKKNIIFLSVSLMLIILLGIGISYSMWNISVSQDTNNTAYTECFDLSITNKENNINLDNAYPISNDKGKSLTPYTFTVTNTCDITTQYNINLEVLNSSTLSSKFIDVMFEGNINLLSSYDTTDKVNTSSIESRKLTTGILKSQESKDYSLRLWIDYNTTLEDLNNEIKSFKSKIVVVGKPINYTGDTVFNFDYTGAEQTFIAPVSGTYKLETWGAQGGSGGRGGYSTGYLNLNLNNSLYIAIGGSGSRGNGYFTDNVYLGTGGWNGGGNGGLGAVDSLKRNYAAGSGGGGASSIQNILINDGQLFNYENKKENVIIVSGGGGGICLNHTNSAGNGGGVCGTASKPQKSNVSEVIYGGKASPGTQNAGYSFGKGETSPNKTIYDSYGAEGNGGGGGGWYGGFANTSEGYVSCDSGGGGSGYIGNPFLKNKVMYCYNCEESNEESTKTISTTCNEETPTSYCSKMGNGYARITLVSIDE